VAGGGGDVLCSDKGASQMGGKFCSVFATEHVCNSHALQIDLFQLSERLTVKSNHRIP